MFRRKIILPIEEVDRGRRVKLQEYYKKKLIQSIDLIKEFNTGLVPADYRNTFFFLLFC